MISYEVIQNLRESETIAGQEKYKFHGVNLEFRNFQPNLVLIDEAQLKKIKKFLYDSYLMSRGDSPDQALVIYDGAKPRLFILKGTKEWWLETEEKGWEYYKDEGFLKICKIDLEDNEIFCETSFAGYSLGYHQLDSIYYAHHCLPKESKSGGTITLWKDDTRLFFKVDAREGFESA